MPWLAELLLKIIFVDVIYPIALQLAMRREADPFFKAESDRVYGAIHGAKTTAERRALARKLYDLQKSS